MTAGAPPVVATVLTGFLGAGKTTLLNRLLADPGLADTAVLINEFGAVGLDHLLVAAVDGEVVLLKSGCICCSIRTDLKDAVLGLFARVQRGEFRPFRRLVVETTGLADPVPILATLSADPMLKYHFRIGSVVTVVGAPDGVETLWAHTESRRQVAVADHLVVTKTDLAGPARIAELVALLETLNPAAALHAPGADPVAAVVAALDAPAAQSALWTGLGATVPGVSHAGIGSALVTADRPVEWARFALWLSLLLHRHGNSLLRLKGLVEISGAGTPLVVQGVQHLIHRPVHLDAWPPGPRGTRLVLIGESLDAPLLQRSFDAIVQAPQTASA